MAIEQDPRTRSSGVSRRMFIQQAGLLTAAVGLARRLEPMEGVLPAAVLQQGPTFSRRVVRPEDMVALDIDFYNLAISIEADGAFLKRVASGAAYIVFNFPPQAVFEKAHYEASPGYQASPPGAHDIVPPVDARLSGWSRLAFKVPDDVTEIPYELDDLLDWSGWNLKVAPAAVKGLTRPVGRYPPIRQPLEYETSIEAPFRVHLSPNENAFFEHSPTTVEHDGWVELWHTRLNEDYGAQRGIGEQLPGVRAIWTPGFSSKNPLPAIDDPWLASLTPKDRWQIVKLTADVSLNKSPKAARAEQLMLSSLGAWMNVKGFWDKTAVTSLLHWRHQMTMGREHYIRVVYAGCLKPFGHQAALIGITERKFEKIKTGTLAGEIVAGLRQRWFILVKEKTRRYPVAAQPDKGRDLPFKRVTLKTIITPNLDPREDGPLGGGLAAKEAFWVRVANQELLWHVEAEDHDGNVSEFAMPMAWVDSTICDNHSNAEKSSDAYNGASEARRKAELKGQAVAFAPSKVKGDTTLEVKNMIFTTRMISGGPSMIAQFSPALESAGIRMQAVEQVKGSSLGVGPTQIRYHSAYVTGGFASSNKAAVFVQLADTQDLGFGDSTDKAGGVITPNLSIGAISRTFGPMGGMAPAGPGSDAPLPAKFKPEDFFAGAVPQLLGVDNLLIQIIEEALFSQVSKVPQLISENIYPGDDPSKLPIGNRTKFHWVPDVGNSVGNIFTGIGGGKPGLVLDATVEARVDLPAPSRVVKGDLTDFAINLFGDSGPTYFMTIAFNSLTFTSNNGEKPKVDVDIQSVKFGGVLEFVEKLKDYLDFGDSGPSLDVTPTGITAGYTLGIPDVSVGVFTLQNISFSAGLELFFTGKPMRSRFAFCTRENPFLLTVSAFGGGGFFGLGIGLDGIELFEMSLEFGASIALDIGVASGEVHVLGGVYIKIEQDPDNSNKENALLSGYVRLGGSLEVLGIITLSIEFKMELTYEKKGDDSVVYGQASLTVEVEVLMFSASVTMTVKREFAGSSSGGSAKFASRSPRSLSQDSSAYSFEDFFEETDWNKYAAAFAAYS